MCASVSGVPKHENVTWTTDGSIGQWTVQKILSNSTTLRHHAVDRMESQGAKNKRAATTCSCSFWADTMKINKYSVIWSNCGRRGWAWTWKSLESCCRAWHGVENGFQRRAGIGATDNGGVRCLAILHQLLTRCRLGLGTPGTAIHEAAVALLAMRLRWCRTSVQHKAVAIPTTYIRPVMFTPFLSLNLRHAQTRVLPTRLYLLAGGWGASTSSQAVKLVLTCFPPSMVLPLSPCPVLQQLHSLFRGHGRIDSGSDLPLHWLRAQVHGIGQLADEGSHCDLSAVLTRSSSWNLWSAWELSSRSVLGRTQVTFWLYTLQVQKLLKSFILRSTRWSATIKAFGTRGDWANALVQIQASDWSLIILRLGLVSYFRCVSLCIGS